MDLKAPGVRRSSPSAKIVSYKTRASEDYGMHDQGSPFLLNLIYAMRMFFLYMAPITFLPTSFQALRTFCAPFMIINIGVPYNRSKKSNN
jgi:hypothetical protein